MAYPLPLFPPLLWPLPLALHPLPPPLLMLLVVPQLPGLPWPLVLPLLLTWRLCPVGWGGQACLPPHPLLMLPLLPVPFPLPPLLLVMMRVLRVLRQVRLLLCCSLLPPPLLPVLVALRPRMTLRGGTSSFVHCGGGAA